MNGNGQDHSIEKRVEIAERMIAALFESHERTQTEIRALTAAQVVMTEQIKELAAEGKKVDLRLAELSDKLDGLISLMDQHLRDHQQGRA